MAQSPFAKVVKKRGSLHSDLRPLQHAQSGEPWRDVRLRQAVNLAINREDLIRYATKGNGVIIPALLRPRGLGMIPPWRRTPLLLTQRGTCCVTRAIPRGCR